MSNEQHGKPGSPNKDHDFNIIVNGRPKKVVDEVQTFDSIAALSGLPTGPDTIFTITYRKGHNEGTLVAGGSVTIENGMIFNVTATDKS
jgi:hypothetical protein